MDNLTITKLCALANGFTPESDRYKRGIQVSKRYPSSVHSWWYDPLHDDAQMVALGKKFPYEFERSIIEWCSHFRRNETVDLNRIVCERIAFAEMEAAKDQ